MNTTTASRWFALATVSLLALSLAVACGGDDDDGGGNGTIETRTGSPTATSPSGDGNGEEQTVKISLKDNFFEPKDITVPVNTTIKVELKNDGAAIHNMNVLAKKGGEPQDFKSETIIAAGDEDEFEMRFTKTGKFDFQCDYHVPDMVGTITVQ